jgi:hypothetical protein
MYALQNIGKTLKDIFLHSQHTEPDLIINPLPFPMQQNVAVHCSAYTLQGHMNCLVCCDRIQGS